MLSMVLYTIETLLPSNATDNIEDLVVYYHNVRPKFKYKEICSIISSHHKRDITMSKIKSILKNKGLNRKRNVSEADLKEIIDTELSTSLSSIGYRQMTECLSIKYGVNVAKEDVRKALKVVDPNGVEKRKNKTIVRREYLSRGPGSVYHIDGNDKLKRWGFCIHGCVDGFSRKLIWLVVASTNKDPLVIANFYLQCIRKYNLAPELLRMDKG